MVAVAAPKVLPEASSAVAAQEGPKQTATAIEGYKKTTTRSTNSSSSTTARAGWVNMGKNTGRHDWRFGKNTTQKMGPCTITIRRQVRAFPPSSLELHMHHFIATNHRCLCVGDAIHIFL